MQLNMTTPTDIGMEQGGEGLFSTKTVGGGQYVSDQYIGEIRLLEISRKRRLTYIAFLGLEQDHHL